jgi:hypothetical protein
LGRLTEPGAGGCAAPSRLLGAKPLLVPGGQDDLEFPFLGHRVLVLLTEEPLLHEDIERWGVVGAPHFAGVEVDRTRVLLPTEDQFRFFLALRVVTPHGHQDGHQERHDADAHQEHSHRVAALAALTL